MRRRHDDVRAPERAAQMTPGSRADRDGDSARRGGLRREGRGKVRQNTALLGHESDSDWNRQNMRFRMPLHHRAFDGVPHKSPAVDGHRPLCEGDPYALVDLVRRPRASYGTIGLLRSTLDVRRRP